MIRKVTTKIPKPVFVVLMLLSFAIEALPQEQDSVSTQKLQTITIDGEKLLTIQRLPAIKGTHIWAGRKNEVINVGGMDANIAEKTPRQIFSKVPGVFVYDMDGTGNQTNISTRGLDPHRGWEYNNRKNGIITNSDMYGYPASHYSMPMEAIDHIELVRGTGSLQYGAQFGGMINYISKRPDSTRAISFETINSLGSYGTLSTYHALSGTVGKFQYYTYYNKRVSDGYRKNSNTDFDAQSLMLIYSPSKTVNITAEIARSNYLFKIPGPLTDSMFHADPRQSTRLRNYFNPEIYVPSLTLDWKISDRTSLSWTVSAVLGHRNSVQFDKPATTPDALNTATLQYANRQVDIDNFNSYTSELRVLHQYSFSGIMSALSAGAQFFNNDLHRQQLGKGTTGADFDLQVDGAFGRDLHFRSKNIALFAENIFWLTPEWSITPGVRMEIGKSDMTGTITYYNEDDLPNTIEHTFPLFGLNTEYTLKRGNIYAGFSQAYRPVLFKDIIPASTYERTDKSLQDAEGYNAELGYRGMSENFRWDVSGFMLRYNNRPGSIAQEQGANGNYYILRTTIGNSLTSGIEMFGECVLFDREKVSIQIFTSTSFFRSEYLNAMVRAGNENVNISGNKVESVPSVITRNGLTLHIGKLSSTFLYSYTGESFADPLNTVTPSASGSVGVVPSYGVLDFNSTLRVMRNLQFRFNLNNVTNKSYFTKRPAFYPGPGVWSSDGRSINFTVSYKI